MSKQTFIRVDEACFRNGFTPQMAVVYSIIANTKKGSIVFDISKNAKRLNIARNTLLSIVKKLLELEVIEVANIADIRGYAKRYRAIKFYD